MVHSMADQLVSTEAMSRAVRKLKDIPAMKVKNLYDLMSTFSMEES